MDEFSPNLTKLWKEWNVRVTVLLSFTLQVVLIVLGKRRKHDSRLWIRIVTWCAYLSADFFATYALGLITNNMSHFHEKNYGSMDANTELTAFWAPFLLMHLGGPDTITAYSLEDNELWLRHLLGLVLQMVMAIYVCVMAWTGSLLSFLSLLMFFAGLIKYGERSWVLRKASVEEITKSYTRPGCSHVMLNSFHWCSKNSLGHNLFDLMYICLQPVLLDFNESIFLYSFRFFQTSSEEDAFQMIEMSLAFMYSILYTKALLLYTHVGLFLRVITIILTSSVSVLLPVLIHKHKFSKIDVTITFILLYGAIILEICSALLLLFSDRFQLWLIEHSKCSMPEVFKGVLSKKKRWSNKMSQLSLLSFIMKEKPMPCGNFLKHFSIFQKLENQWYVADIEVSNDLKKLILNYLEIKRDHTTPSDSEIPDDLKKLILTYEKIKGNQTTPSDIEIPSEILNRLSNRDLSKIPTDLKKLILAYLETKRDQTAPSESLSIYPCTAPIESLSIDVSGMDFTKEIDKSILAWHVATEIWYEMDREVVMGKGHAHAIELICQISRYMFSLLVLHPNMVSNPKTTKFTLQPILVAARGSSFASRIAACQNLTELLQRTVSEIEDLTKGRMIVSQLIRHDFFDEELPKLLRQLREKSWEERWMIISCVWLEMLAYAAYKCRGIQHAQRLKCGGEFLTHVWFLTKYLGFTEKDFTSHAPSWARSIIDLRDTLPEVDVLN